MAANWLWGGASGGWQAFDAAVCEHIETGWRAGELTIQVPNAEW